MLFRSWPFANGQSQIASAHHVDDPQYEWASSAIGESNLYHRKHWEWVYILATANHFGVLRKDASALGFGVGSEPLVAAFAAAGMSITATDQPAAQAGAWATTGQHSTSLEQLQRPTICDPDTLAERVDFKAVDMTELPADLGEHSLVWSSCCFEHLGSAQAGIDFVLNSMKFVAPGGIAIHTTEFDTTRTKPLLETGSLAAGDYACFYRRPELEGLISELRQQGFSVDIDWRVSKRHKHERNIDRPPYSHQPHMRVAVEDRVMTSIGLVISRPIKAPTTTTSGYGK